MVIEHSFVTTLDAGEAMSRASDFLQQRGFEVEPRAAFSVAAPAPIIAAGAATLAPPPQQQGWTDLSVKRGKKNVARARDATECPQRIHLEWDRGRVSVAASITPKPSQRSVLIWGVVGVAIMAASSRGKKTGREESELMLSIARSLEQLLGTGVEQQPQGMIVGQEWDFAEQRIKEASRRARRRSWIFLGILLAAIAAIIVIIAIAASK
jgi:hypothetical protein